MKVTTSGQLCLTLALILVGFGCSRTLRADLLAYDPFLSGDIRGLGEYTPGQDIRTQGAAAFGWVGTSGVDGFGVAHSGNTTNFIANALGEDAFQVPYDQGGRLQWLGVGNFPFAREITRQLNPLPPTDDWWLSIQANRLAWNGDPANNTFAVGGFTDASGNGLQLGYDDSAGDGAPDLVIRLNGANEVLIADAPANDNQFLLARLQVNTAGNDTLSLWFAPDEFINASSPTLVIDDENITDSLTPFTQSRFESPGQSGVVFWDEIRLGTSFDAVTEIPEPNSVAISVIAIAGTAVLRHRRRQKPLTVA